MESIVTIFLADKAQSVFDMAKHHVIDIGTPGAITLVFQAILPFLVFHSPASSHDVPRPIHITIKGGTNVSNAPSYDYVCQVLLPMLSLVGLPNIEARLDSRGWSTGRPEMGSITFEITPLAASTSLMAFTLTDRGAITGIRATVLAPRQAEKDIQRELRKALRSTLPDIKDVELSFEDSRHHNRLYILLVAKTANGMRLGRDYLYDRRISSYSHAAGQMARQVVDELAEEIEHGGCVDVWLRDQLIVFQALSSSVAESTAQSEADERTNDSGREGRSKSTVFGGNSSRAKGSEMSLHAQTAWWVCQRMLGVNAGSDDGIDGCDGIGFVVGGQINKTAEGEKAARGSAQEPRSEPRKVEERVEDVREMLERRLRLED